jgi:hypothetical protein
VALLSISVISCVSTATTVLNPTLRRSPVTPDKVVIYTSAAKVPGKYEEIALLTSQGDYSVAGDDKFFESFRKEAAKIGANGVIVSDISDPTTGQKVGSAILGALLIPTTMANRKTQAMAIYVTTPAEEAAKAEEAVSRAAQAARIDTLDQQVHAGVTRKEMFAAVGPPTSTAAQVNTRGEVEETATYVGSRGQVFTIFLRNNIVTEVSKK